MFHGMNQVYCWPVSVTMTEWWSLNTERHSTDRGPLPGDIVWRASGDAGFKGVGAIHAHRVKGLVVTETKGIEVDVGLGSSSGARLTWKHTHAIFKEKKHVTYSSFLWANAWVYTGLCHSIQDSSLPRWLQVWITNSRHCEILLWVQLKRGKKVSR